MISPASTQSPTWTGIDFTASDWFVVTFDTDALSTVPVRLIELFSVVFFRTVVRIKEA